VELVADGDQPAIDRQAGMVGVEVVPSKAEQLTAAHAGVGREPQGGEQPVADRGTQERLKLAGGPGVLFDLGDGPQPRGGSGEGDVAVHQAAAHRTVERPRG
jgi:hypothetical protein